MRRWRGLALMTATTLGGASCSPVTQLLISVTVSGDRPIAAAVAETYDDAGALVDGPRSFVLEAGGSTFAVVPRAGDASRRVTVVVTGCAAAPAAGEACPDPLAESRMRTAFLPGRSVSIRVELSSVCTGVVCPDAFVCRAVDGAAACEPALDGEDAGPLDSAIRDAGTDATVGTVDVGTDAPSDAGSDAGCLPATERCNALDDDCDGRADEGAVCVFDFGDLLLGDNDSSYAPSRSFTVRLPRGAASARFHATGEDGLDSADAIDVNGTEAVRITAAPTSVSIPGGRFVAGDNSLRVRVLGTSSEFGLDDHTLEGTRLEVTPPPPP